MRLNSGLAVGVFVLCGCFNDPPTLDPDNTSEASSSEGPSATVAPGSSATPSSTAAMSTGPGPESSSDATGRPEASSSSDGGAGSGGAYVFDLWEEACGPNMEWEATPFPEGMDVSLTCGAATNEGSVEAVPVFATDFGDFDNAIVLNPPLGAAGGVIHGATVDALPLAGGTFSMTVVCAVSTPEEFTWDIGYTTDDGVDTQFSALAFCDDGPTEITLELDATEDRRFSVLIVAHSGNHPIVGFVEPRVIVDL